MDSTAPRGSSAWETVLLLLLVAGHLALCVALVFAGVGSIYAMQDDVGSVQILTPFVVGAVLGVVERAALGTRVAARAWLLTLAASFAVAVVGYRLFEVADDLLIVAMSMITVVGAGVTALGLIAIDAVREGRL
jgi:hypothetical protein